jgi:hypothetical protein
MPSPAIRELARRLAAYETSVGESSVPAAPGAFLVYEKLRQPLCTLAGVGGFYALATRALTLARTDASSFGAVQVTADGRLERLRELDPQRNKDWNDEVGVILIAELLGLLITFVGRALTLRLLQDVWPDEAFDDLISGDGRRL